MSTDVITASDLHKVYGRKSNAFTALRGISLAIRQGESIAIVGKSGSGKSTLMHVLAGLDRPTTGKIAWNGQELAGMSERKMAHLRNANVGFIFQQFFLQPTLTVLENTYLPLKIAGVASARRKKLAADALKAVGLESKANNRATDLSGGQKQRVAIARAIVGKPTVIFADEPTGNLDSETGRQIVALLFQLQKSRGITLVIVTHDEDLAKRCNRVLHIQDGRLAA